MRTRHIANSNGEKENSKRLDKIIIGPKGSSVYFGNTAAVGR